MQIVIVDDDPVNLSIYAGLLETAGHETVNSFEDPNQALAHCRARAADLVIVDYLMPRMNGIEFVRELRRIPELHETPVIMVTATQDSAVRQSALEIGATEFLSKPIDPAEFKVRVQNMLQLRDAYIRLSGRAQNLAMEVARATAEIRANERDTLYALARAAEYRDPETGAHILRMANYARLIAGEMGMSGREQELVMQAAPLHDIGKIGTPDHILLKPGALDAEERRIMDRHATNGWEILRSHISPVLQAGAVIAHSHHEKYDGSGYPGGLARDDIPIFGRVVAVADVFDALSSKRPYKEPWPAERARQYVADAGGSHFDPQCVDGFMKSWPRVLEVMAAHPG